MGDGGAGDFKLRGASRLVGRPVGSREVGWQLRNACCASSGILGERRNPDDALLDAVIAWENLVGADEGETTLRITTALAWLLNRSPSERAATEERLRVLYRLRSPGVGRVAL